MPGWAQLSTTFIPSPNPAGGDQPGQVPSKEAPL